MHCTALRMWPARKEVYAGHVDGSVNVFAFNPAMTSLKLVASLMMHQAAIHSLHVLSDLNFAISSGFDSTLTLWQPPEKWERKLVCTQSMNQALNPKEDLATIREDLEQEGNETFVKRKASVASDDKLLNNLEAFQALLSKD